MMYPVEHPLLPKEIEHAWACAKEHLLRQSEGLGWERCMPDRPLLAEPGGRPMSASHPRSRLAPNHCAR